MFSCDLQIALAVDNFVEMYTANLQGKQIKVNTISLVNWDAQKSLTMVLVYKETGLTEIMIKQNLLIRKDIEFNANKTILTWGTWTRSLQIIKAKPLPFIIYSKILLSIRYTALGLVERVDMFYSFINSSGFICQYLLFWNSIFLLA